MTPDERVKAFDELNKNELRNQCVSAESDADFFKLIKIPKLQEEIDHLQAQNKVLEEALKSKLLVNVAEANKMIDLEKKCARMEEALQEIAISAPNSVTKIFARKALQGDSPDGK